MLPLGNDAMPSVRLPSWGPFNFSAHLRLLPYLEEGTLHDRFRLDLHITDAANLPLLATNIEMFHCPSEWSRQVSLYTGAWDSFPETLLVAHTNYVGSHGSRWYGFCSSHPRPARRFNNGVIMEEPVRVRFKDITDGASKTILFAERARGRMPDPESWNWWADGYGGSTLFIAFHPINKSHMVTGLQFNSDYSALYGGASSFHPGGANVCFVDGSVHFLADDTDSWDLTDADIAAMCDVNTPFGPKPGIFQALTTRNGGEVIRSY
jgi:prepilin-type processing-associated H-X9-DG protein